MCATRLLVSSSLLYSVLVHYRRYSRFASFAGMRVNACSLSRKGKTSTEEEEKGRGQGVYGRSCDIGELTLFTAALKEGTGMQVTRLLL